jgi:hypothetical protein
MKVVAVTIGAPAPTKETSASLTWRDPARPEARSAPFDDLPEAVDAPVAEAVAHGVERQFAVELDTPVLDEIEGLAFLGRAVRQVEMTIGIALLPYDLTRETATVCTVKSGASP